MHELSLCQAMMEIIKHHENNLCGKKINKIILEVGQLAAIDPSSMQFAFEAVSSGTLAENAKLEFIEIEGKAICDSCQKTVKLKHYYDACEYCGRFSLQITQGDGLLIKSMEVS